MRNTKQREEILNFLRSNHSHFTASQIYDSVREKHPDISLGTIYRNLGKLCESGEILMIGTSEKTDYYDVTLMPHMHFVCQKCGEIYDLPIDSAYSKSIEALGFEIEPCRTVYYGTCNKCLKNFNK